MSNSKKKITVASVVLGIFLFNNACYSQSEMEEKLPNRSVVDEGENRIYMGVSGGVNSPAGSNIATSTEVGVSVGHQPEMKPGIGVEVTNSQLQDSDKYQRTSVMAQSAYKIGGDIPLGRTSYMGLGAGPIFVKNKVRWAIAPALGFDIPLNNRTHDVVSLGLNAKYVGVTKSVDSYVGSATVKYWY
jgi:hypothetical protein